jgi:hypothetical protein
MPYPVLSLIDERSKESSGDFEHYAVEGTGIFVSICGVCVRFVAAAPDPLRLGIAEAAHLSAHGLKKRPASVRVAP